MHDRGLEIRALTDDEIANVSGGSINLERLIVAAGTKAFGMLWDKYGDEITSAAEDLIGAISGPPETVPGNLI
jgi:hypothetical protein